MLPFLRPKNAYLTCCGRDDGGGAQIAACISTMIMARLKGMTYAHTPLSTVAHRPAHLSETEWAAAWEKFFNLGQGEASAEEVSKNLPTIGPVKAHRFFPRSNRLYVLPHAHKVTDRHPLAWHAIAPELRRKYQSSPKPLLANKPAGAIEIAIHLRRGDVGRSGRFSERFTPLDAVLPGLRRMLAAMKGRSSEIHVFSQGDPGDFTDLVELGAVLHLDEDPFVSFHHMVRADVLFVAKSTFSYLAALLGEGRVIYDPFWHPALPDWTELAELERLPDASLAPLSPPDQSPLDND